MRFTKARSSRGEFLLMLLIAVAIIGILAGILAPVLANKLDDAQMRSESEALMTLRKDFEATYDSVDYANLNEASVPASGLPPGTVMTNFDQANGIAARIFSPTVTVDPAGWVTKLAQKRGVTSYAPGDTFSALEQSQYTAIAFNAYNSQRCLVVGPAGEAGQQRYMLISLMVPPYRALAFPTADATQTFNSIWDQTWESVDSQAPATWATLMSRSQFSLWNTPSANNRTNASRLLVQRIVQPKYTLTLANNNPVDTAWVDIGPAANAMVAAPNSGTSTSTALAGFSSGILSGRLIVVRRGPSAAAAYEVQRFYLYSDVNLTVQ
jgi:type II secretory pathway pseudopilin PulG